MYLKHFNRDCGLRLKLEIVFSLSVMMFIPECQRPLIGHLGFLLLVISSVPEHLCMFDSDKDGHIQRYFLLSNWG